MFIDRYDAGRRLASQMLRLKNGNLVVYALPRGGVLVGREIARALHAPLDLVITRKIGHPFNSEYAICAITEEGHRICSEFGISEVDRVWIENESKVQQHEAKRRRLVYKHNEAMVSPNGKVAVLVDDGVATGLTMKAAILTIKKKNPARIIVAVPVAPHEVVVELKGLVDEVIVLKDDPQYLGSVGAYYENFPEVFDKEVTACLQQGSKYKTHTESNKIKTI